ncbi:MAG: hypothetical protein IKZ88_10150 [Neisseriaceae bacterium]|nr:hypothetical protein [Neisseriaceae bacterium]
MSFQRLWRCVLPIGKTGLPRFFLTKKSRNDTVFCFRLPESTSRAGNSSLRALKRS